MTFDSEYEPFFQPPGWIIGPVWMVLYTMIAISFYLVITNRNELNNFYVVCSFFIIQLALNLLWPGVFNSEKYLLSLVMIVAMVIFSTLYAIQTYSDLPYASKLFWPYIAWISFATIINVAYYLEFK